MQYAPPLLHTSHRLERSWDPPSINSQRNGLPKLVGCVGTVEVTYHYDRVASPTPPLHCTDHQCSQNMTIPDQSKIVNMPKEDPCFNLEIKATVVPHVKQLLEPSAYIYNVVTSISTLTLDRFWLSRDLRFPDVQRTMRHDLGVKCYYGRLVYPIFFLIPHGPPVQFRIVVKVQDESCTRWLIFTSENNRLKTRLLSPKNR